jgi:hypothetical protein
MEVLWSDEKKFELFNSKRRQVCRRRKGEALRDDTVQATVKHGGGSAMFWGCFGGSSLGNLFKVEGIMRKEQYHSILVRHAILSGNRIYSDKTWVFQEDNDPKHASKLCRDYLSNKIKLSDDRISKMDWPPQSPDISPIELLWEELDRAVLKKKPSCIKDLERVVREAWGEISQKTLEKLVSRMPRLCQAVLDAKGGYFDEKLCAYKHMKPQSKMVYH